MLLLCCSEILSTCVLHPPQCRWFYFANWLSLNQGAFWAPQESLGVTLQPPFFAASMTPCWLKFSLIDFSFRYDSWCCVLRCDGGKDRWARWSWSRSALCFHSTPVLRFQQISRYMSDLANWFEYEPLREAMDSGVHLFLKHAIDSTFQQGCASLRANTARKNLAPVYLPGDLGQVGELQNAWRHRCGDRHRSG